MFRAMDGESATSIDWIERYLEVIDDLVIVAEANTGTILRANDVATRRLSGVNDSLVGSYVVKLVHRDDRPLVAEALATLDSTNPECQLTLRLNEPDQAGYSTFKVYLRLIPERDEILVINRETTELSQTQERVAHFRRFIELTADIMVVTKLDGTIIEANPAAAAVHGLSLESIRGRAIADFIHPDWLERWEQVPELILAGGGRARCTMGGLRPDGSPILFDCITVVDWEQNLAYTVERDITEAENQKHRLEEANRFFTITNDLLVRLDENYRILVCNAAFAEFAGSDHIDLVGRDIFEFLSLANGARGEAFSALSDEVLRSSEGTYELVTHSTQPKNRRTFSVSVQRDDASNSVYLAARDITDERHLTSELRTLAETDSLTGVANRMTFERRLQAELDAGRDVALAFLDLDNFKRINDSLGHATGDEMLKVVAKRMQGCVRSKDVVARFGGDEFCVMLTNHDSTQTIDPLARVIREAVGDPMNIGGRRLVTSCSVGVAVSTPEIRQAADLMKRGDAAAYAAKGAGRNRVVVFDDALDEQISNRFELEEELRHGLDSGQLDLDVQGVFDGELKLAGVEALLRWDHPTKGRIGPDQFLDVAEGAGLMPQISDRVLERAFESVSPWLRANDRSKLSVNLSPRQLANPALVDQVCEATSFYGIPARQVILEITEETLVESIDHTGATLRKLQGEGFRLAMDDFGKGASSLGHLRDFPFQVVKIDKGFIDCIDSDSVNRAIVESVIGLANRLGIVVVAEGIESQQHVDALVSLGCHRLQGFYIHRPEPVADAEILKQEATSQRGRPAWPARRM